MTKRIVFMGSCSFSLTILKGLANFLENGWGKIVAVYTAAAKNNASPETPVHTYSQQKNWIVKTPFKLKSEDVQNEFLALKPDLVVLASYGALLPEAFLSGPTWGAINVHPSLLPMWRGSSPVPFTILSGDKEMGVTIMKMDQGMDTGPILAQQAWMMPAEATSPTLFQDLALKSVPLLIQAITGYVSGAISCVPQQHSQASYTRKLTKEDGLLCWTKPAKQLEREVRAFLPWPGSYTMIRTEKGIKRLHILKASVRENGGEPLDVGKFYEDGFLCQDGRLFCPVAVKPEGGKEMPFQAFLRGLRGPWSVEQEK